MVYQQKFVATLKCNNKILREHNNNEIYIPFGSEYIILLKNLNTISCKVKLYIDGNSALDNHELIIKAGETIEVERFIKNNNLNQGNKFKFIEKTQEIEKFRGNQIEDSLIRIEYCFEKQIPLSIPVPMLWPQKYHEYPPKWYEPSPYKPPYEITCSALRGISSTQDYQLYNQGITIPGDISNQEFKIDNTIRLYEEPNNIILKLIGQQQDIKIEKLITVKDTPICSTCGRKNKFKSKFCSNCGTSLILL